MGQPLGPSVGLEDKLLGELSGGTEAFKLDERSLQRSARGVRIGLRCLRGLSCRRHLGRAVAAGGIAADALDLGSKTVDREVLGGQAHLRDVECAAPHVGSAAPGRRYGHDAEVLLEEQDVLDRELGQQPIEELSKIDRLLVVRIGEQPVRRGEDETAVGLQPTPGRGKHGPRVDEVLDHLAQEDGVERARGEGGGKGVEVDEANPLADILLLGGQPPVGLLDRARLAVDAGDVLTFAAQEE